MMEWLRVWFNKGLLVRSGRHGRWAIFQTVRLVRLPFFCVVGIVCVGLAFFVAAELVPTNLSAAVTYVVSGSGATSPVAAKTPENDQLRSGTQTLANTTAAVTLPAMDPEKMNRRISELKPNPTSSIGVGIVGGLALFLWVWRFRNFSV